MGCFHRKMYWSSPDHDSIRWANMDGTEHLQFADNCVQPDGLALLPQADKQRLSYWITFRAVLHSKIFLLLFVNLLTLNVMFILF